MISRGVCWSTNPAPNVTLGTKTIDGIGLGVYTSLITGLVSNTIYYVRAYATNSAGTAYGKEFSFSTTPALPTLTTTNITNINSGIATSGGAIISDGGGHIIAQGICWSILQPHSITSYKDF